MTHAALLVWVFFSDCPVLRGNKPKKMGVGSRSALAHSAAMTCTSICSSFHIIFSQLTNQHSTLATLS
jgi:hypothetical protein